MRLLNMAISISATGRLLQPRHSIAHSTHSLVDGWIAAGGFSVLLLNVVAISQPFSAGSCCALAHASSHVSRVFRPCTLSPSCFRALRAFRVSPNWLQCVAVRCRLYLISLCVLSRRGKRYTGLRRYRWVRRAAECTR